MNQNRLSDCFKLRFNWNFLMAVEPVKAVIPSVQLLIYEVKSVILSATVKHRGTNTNLSHTLRLHCENQAVAHDLEV